eukprot:CAMPEP_0172417584 /NCGR_PEP_ID=MMETSP1064-20121228/4121_1 /TAXON_ID=202472 /ORGANISM="Aulacoseira subarctica , Strain CCAP 1002/5" /LENGTH=559 /DNA_ID=CAMNT_0013156027 /DNA_START=141 /DNA_END=1820 /DNA_ORIENTATION=+
MTQTRLTLPKTLLLFVVAAVVQAENRSFSGILTPSPMYIHYSEGYLVVPGSLDLSGLLFSTSDDGYYQKKNRTENITTTSTSSSSSSGDDLVNDDGKPNRQLQGSSKIDIVVFREPDDCHRSTSGCDWTKLGVGASDSYGNLRWCCANDAIQLNMCTGKNDYGRLILNASLFKGSTRSITIDANGKQEIHVSSPLLSVDEGSGNYVMVMANCNDEGRTVDVAGWYSWKSKGGYLPGDLFGAMYFYIFLALVYVVLLTWYGICMAIYKEATIPIQKWIFVTLLMGVVEMFCKVGDFLLWNSNGTRFWFALYFGVVLGIAKQALSRVLVLMVSLGWGVVRDTLGDQMNKIIFLGSFFFAAATARDIISIISVVDMKTISIDGEEELIGIVEILTLIIAIIDVTFYMWILDALNGTMQYLENMSQHNKLRRYLRLRLILLLSILFAIVWGVFGLVDTFLDEGILTQDSEWAIRAAWELNYLVVLVSVAVLWRPNPAAKDYAFVMELPSVGGDVEFTTNDGVEHPDNEENIHDDLRPPSAADDDDENGDGHDSKFKIDDAVPT